MQRGVSVPSRSTTTSLGQPICIAESIRVLQRNPDASFILDDHEHRRRVTATASYMKVKVKTTKTAEGGLLVELA